MLKRNSNNIQKQFILFIFIGGINTLFGYSMFSLWIYLGFHYVVASLLSTIVGILFNFQTLGRFVFNNKESGRLYRFFGIYGVLYLVNIFLLMLGSHLTTNMYINGAFATILTALISFLLNKFIVFPEKSYETH